jgi:hypothetical protein
MYGRDRVTRYIDGYLILDVKCVERSARAYVHAWHHMHECARACSVQQYTLRNLQRRYVR